MLLSRRFEQAFSYAFHLHQNQLRKGSEIPYISHLLSVAALVIEDGGREDEAIAALLHDAPEDQGGCAILEEIRTLFGPQVAYIVGECSDTFEHPKPNWQKRKEAYLERLKTATVEVRRVALADKLHNARTILFDLRNHGHLVWARFSGGKDGTLWYYRELLTIFRSFKASPMLTAFEDVMSLIERQIDISGEV